MYMVMYVKILYEVMYNVKIMYEVRENTLRTDGAPIRTRPLCSHI